MRISAVRPVLVSLSLLSALGAAACGSSSTNDAPGPVTTSDAGPTSDAGAADSAPAVDAAVGYPAPHQPLPQIGYNGAPLLTGMKVVTVTFDTSAGPDPLRAELEAFGDTIGATPWWDTVRDGYCANGSTSCVGKQVTTPNPHVRATLPQGTGTSGAITDDLTGQSDIKTWMQKMFADGAAGGDAGADAGSTTGFKDLDAQTMYLLYFPKAATIQLGNAQSCVNGGFGGYHQSVPVTAPGGTINVPYAVIARCDPDPTSGRTVDQETTLSASHEILEAATDPIPNTSQYGYNLQTTFHDAAWTIFGGGEAGDLCIIDSLFGASFTTTSGSYTVQRGWSNAAAKASHNPCLPAPTGDIYFNVAPTSAAQNVTVASGSSTTIELDAFSDAPTGDWSLSFHDLGQALGGSSNVLTFKADKTKVHNGDKVQLTISLSGQPVFQEGSSYLEPYAIVSSGSGTNVHVWPAFVVQK